MALCGLIDYVMVPLTLLLKCRAYNYAHKLSNYYTTVLVTEANGG